MAHSKRVSADPAPSIDWSDGDGIITPDFAKGRRAGDDATTAREKLRSMEDLTAFADRCRAHGKKVVLAHGVFDLVHLGHVRHLESAAREGDVLVVDAGRNHQSAFWGELLSTACKTKGVRGVVMNTCSRDLWALNQMDFPVFGIGCTPADSKGRIDVAEIGQPITIDGVSIMNGDCLIGDEDGVVIIPSRVVEETLTLALEKVSGENTVRDELAAGVPVAEVFKKHGIL